VVFIETEKLQMPLAFQFDTVENDTPETLMMRLAYALETNVEWVNGSLYVLADPKFDFVMYHLMMTVFAKIALRLSLPLPTIRETVADVTYQVVIEDTIEIFVNGRIDVLVKNDEIYPVQIKFKHDDNMQCYDRMDELEPWLSGNFLPSEAEQVASKTLGWKDDQVCVPDYVAARIATAQAPMIPDEYIPRSVKKGTTIMLPYCVLLGELVAWKLRAYQCFPTDYNAEVRTLKPAETIRRSYSGYGSLAIQMLWRQHHRRCGLGINIRSCKSQED
jgi:hypothetical protein